MQIKRLWVLLVPALVSVGLTRSTQAQSRTMTIVEAQTGAPVAFARVTVSTMQGDQFADENGRFVVAATDSAITIRIRSIGFTPLDSTFAAGWADRDELRLTMSRLAIRLDAVKVVDRQVCGSAWVAGLAASDTLATIFEQMREHARRSQLLASEYPFRATFVRTRGNTQRNNAAIIALGATSKKSPVVPPTATGPAARPGQTIGDAAAATRPRSATDTTTVSSVRSWSYQPGSLIEVVDDGAGGANEMLRVLQLDDLATDAFIENHCFRYRGTSGRGDNRVIQIDFSPIASLTTPDVSGSFFLSASNYQLRRSVFEVTRASDQPCTKVSSTVETTYRDLARAVPFMAEVEAKTDHDVPDPKGCKRVTTTETKRLLGITDGLTGPLAPGLSRVAMAPRDSLRLVASVREAEQRFFNEWRKEWSIGEVMLINMTGMAKVFRADRAAPEWVTFLTPADSVYIARKYSNSCPVGDEGAEPRNRALTELGFARHPHFIEGQGNVMQSKLDNLCPIWVPGAKQPSDAKWGIDFDLTVGGRAIIKDKHRKPLIRLIDSVAKKIPGDGWISGQRVRMLLDQGEAARARAAADECRSAEWWCNALQGLVAYWMRDLAAADRHFINAVALMSDSVRCEWTDAGLLLSAEERKQYDKLSCAQMDTVNARLWWLAKPLFLEQGNTRRAEFYGRKMIVAIRGSLPYDERWDWGRYRGGLANIEVVERYGWPSSIRYWHDERDLGLLSTRDIPIGLGEMVASAYVPPAAEGDIDWKRSAATRAQDAVIGAQSDRGGAVLSRIRSDRQFAQQLSATQLDYKARPSTVEYWGPQYHTVPTLAMLNDPFAISDSAWDLGPERQTDSTFDNRWWPHEFYQRDAGPLLPLAHQVALFRRERSPVLVAAAAWDTSKTGFDRPVRTVFGVITSEGPDKGMNIATDTAAAFSNHPLIVAVPARPQLLGLEMMPATPEGPARRARLGLTPPEALTALGANAIALSDLMLVERAPAGSPPATLATAIPRMLRSLDLASAGRLAVFWETYGLAATDTTDVALRVSKYDDRGAVRRALSVVGIGTTAGRDSVTIRYRDVRQPEVGSSIEAGRTIRPKELLLDLSTLSAGRYLLELMIQRPGSAAVASRREFTIRK